MALMVTSAGQRTRATRDAILDAALVVIARDGLRAARMEDVAAEAGVSRQSVYYHFRSREEVLDALIDRGLSELASTIRAGAEGRDVEEFVVEAVRFFAENLTLCRLLVTEMWGVASDPQQPRRIVDKAETEIVEPVAARIVEARGGDLDGADAVLAARALMGQVIGVTFGPIVRDEPLDADEIAPQLRAYARAVLEARGDLR